MTSCEAQQALNELAQTNPVLYSSLVQAHNTTVLLTTIDGNISKDANLLDEDHNKDMLGLDSSLLIKSVLNTVSKGLSTAALNASNTSSLDT